MKNSNVNLQATNDKTKGRFRFVKGFISGAIAMAILFTAVNKIGELYQAKLVANSETYNESLKNELANSGLSFRGIAGIIAQLDVQSRTENDTSLHLSYSWEEPEEGSCWVADTNYRVSLPLSSNFMGYENKIAVDVNYPDMVAAGETGVITITAKDKNGTVCTGAYLITPSDDLYLAHGEYSDFHGKIIGDAIDIDDYHNAIVIELCTFDSKYHQKNTDNLSARTGACPTTVVLFNSPLNLDSDL